MHAKRALMSGDDPRPAARTAIAILEPLARAGQLDELGHDVLRDARTLSRRGPAHRHMANFRRRTSTN
jgi:hypothetical protein